MKMTKFILLSTMITMSLFANAAFTISGEISRIYPSNSTVKFRLKNDNQCNPNSKYYYFDLDSEVKKAWFAMILAAANTSKPVRVSIHQCPTDADVEVRYVYQDF